MIKKLLVLSASMLVASSVSAYTLIGEGHVSEPIIVKNDPSFQVIENAGTLHAMPSSEKKTMSGTSRASVSNVSGKVNQHIRVTGDHSVYITNTTSTVQMYKYRYELNIDGYKAGYYERNVDLKPGAVFSTSDMTVGDLNKQSAGSYRLMANTQSDGYAAYSTDTSYGTGYVSK